MHRLQIAKKEGKLQRPGHGIFSDWLCLCLSVYDILVDIANFSMRVIRQHGQLHGLGSHLVAVFWKESTGHGFSYDIASWILTCALHIQPVIEGH